MSWWCCLSRLSRRISRLLLWWLSFGIWPSIITLVWTRRGVRTVAVHEESNVIQDNINITTIDVNILPEVKFLSNFIFKILICECIFTEQRCALYDGKVLYNYGKGLHHSHISEGWFSIYAYTRVFYAPGFLKIEVFLIWKINRYTGYAKIIIPYRH